MRAWFDELTGYVGCDNSCMQPIWRLPDRMHIEAHFAPSSKNRFSTRQAAQQNKSQSICPANGFEHRGENHSGISFRQALFNDPSCMAAPRTAASIFMPRLPGRLALSGACGQNAIASPFGQCWRRVKRQRLLSLASSWAAGRSDTAMPGARRPRHGIPGSDGRAGHVARRHHHGTVEVPVCP